jgi:hypothetical protein
MTGEVDGTWLNVPDELIERIEREVWGPPDPGSWRMVVSFLAYVKDSQDTRMSLEGARYLFVEGIEDREIVGEWSKAIELCWGVMLDQRRDNAW